MADTQTKWIPKEAWRRLRLEAKAAQNYHLPYSLYLGQTHRDALLEQLLPNLLHIKAVAILDDALELWLKDNGHNLPSNYRNDLNGRIRYFGDHGLIKSPDVLHQIRKRRNALAHEPGKSIDWSVLESDLLSIELCLIPLGLVRETLKLEFYAERSAIEESLEPGIKFSRRFEYGVKEDGKRSLEISWEQKFHED